jgi:hypothetical protein
MYRIATLLGVLQILSAGALAGVGAYDGVLTATQDPLAAATPDQEVLLRITLTAQAPATQAGQALREEAVLPSALEGALNDPRWRAAEAEHPELAGVPMLVRFEDDAPPTGKEVVARGTLEAHVALLEHEQGVEGSKPILLFHVGAWHEPLVF